VSILQTTKVFEKLFSSIIPKKTFVVAGRFVIRIEIGVEKVEQ
jgi:hypothetical protein